MEADRSSNSYCKSGMRTPRSGIAIHENSGTTTYSNHSNSQEVFKRDDDQYMPVANIIKIMRHILPPHAKIADEAKETIQECVSEFIGFITSEANEKCHGEHRKIITPEDVISAMEALGFSNYVEPLIMYLNKLRSLEAERNSLQRFPFLKRNSNYVQVEPYVTRPPPAVAGYAPPRITYPSVNPNNYVGPSQMSNNYIQNFDGQGGSSNKIHNQEAEGNSLQCFPFVNCSMTFVQPEPPVTQPPPPLIGYAPSFAKYPVDPNNYVGSSQMNNYYIHNLGGQGGSSFDNLEFDPSMQFK